MPSSGFSMGPLIIGEESQTALDYCTLADVEAYAGVDFSAGIGPTDSQIATLISNASRFIDAYLGAQQAGTVTVEEWFDTTFFGQHIVCGIRPVQSITSIQEVKGDLEELTMTQSRSRDDGDYWLGDSDAGIIRFNMKFGETLNNRLKVTYIAGNSAPPAMVKLATILMVVRNASRAALNDENCLDRIKDMWMNLQSSVQSELDFVLRELAKEKLVGVATFGNSGAY